MIAFRLALQYAAIFTVMGVLLPFWPVWLRAQGVDAVQIGLLLALGTWTKVAANPLLTPLADRPGMRQRLILLLATGSAASFALFGLAHGFWVLAMLTLLANFLYAPLVPLSDSLTLLLAREKGLDYGRIRLWGSLAFILVAVGAGRALAGRPAALILDLLVAAGLLMAAAALLLPRSEVQLPAARPGRPWHLLRSPVFLLFLAAASAAQVSHAVYYGFATLHWRAAGLGSGAIGLLWGEGVIAEVILFAFGEGLVRRLGPARLIALSGLAGVIRWTALASGSALPLLVAVQGLHAFTFAAAHLGAMHFIARAVPPRLSATAQGTYAAVTMGVMMGLAMLAAGPLYQAFGGRAFLAMSGLSALAVAAALALGRRWNGETLAL